MRIIFLVFVLLAAGCTGGSPLPVKVTGTVLLDGNPMSDGDIYFHPTDGRPPVQTKISEGQYALETLPGEYRVMIQQYRDSGTKNVYGDPQMKSTIPARYNVNSDLKATVTQEGSNEFNFPVQSR
jgi:hypothetical protein